MPTFSYFPSDSWAVFRPMFRPTFGSFKAVFKPAFSYFPSETVATRQRQTQRDRNKLTYAQRCTGADRDKPRQAETRRRQTDADVDRRREAERHRQARRDPDKRRQTGTD